MLDVEIRVPARSVSGASFRWQTAGFSLHLNLAEWVGYLSVVSFIRIITFMRTSYNHDLNNSQRSTSKYHYIRYGSAYEIFFWVGDVNTN
jgi:hypothetical protein